MRFVLWAAAAANLAEGAWLLARPLTFLQWAGRHSVDAMPSTQFAGLLLGVLGLAFALAARDPLRQWPLLAVGTASKIVPSVWAWWTVPGDHVTAALTVDGIWAVPLAWILYRASQSNRVLQDLVRSAAAGPALSVLARVRTGSGATLSSLTERGPAVFVFLRHTGCTFCRETLHDLSRARASLDASGIRIVLIHLSSEKAVRDLLLRYGLSGVELVPCHDNALYRAFGLRRGTVGQLFGPKVWMRGAVTAFLHGHGLGPADGDPLQMPGVFLLDHGRIAHAYYHRSAADRPDYRAISARSLKSHQSY